MSSPFIYGPNGATNLVPNALTNNFIDGFTSTATAAGTTTLTSTSNCQQYFTGTSTQTIVLPVATTMVNGQSFIINNLSTGSLTVNTSGSVLLVTISPSTQAVITCINNAGGTGTASWNSTLSSNLGGFAGTSMISYSLTIGATITPPTPGTPTVNQAFWSRVGDKMNIRYDLSSPAGSSGSGVYLFPLPSGYTIDTTKITVSGGGNYPNVGTAAVYSSNSSELEQTGYVVAYNSTNLALVSGNNANAMNLVSSSHCSAGNGIVYSFTAEVPIVGWSANIPSASLGTPPTQQRFTTGGSSGTYTTPTSPAPLYIRVQMVGGGGGGAASGSAVGGSVALNGGDTTFGTSLLIAGHGAAAGFGSIGGAGGTPTINSGPIGQGFYGASGNGGSYNASANSQLAGGSGGSSPFGGAGSGASGGSSPINGGSAAASTGSGGGGGSTSSTTGVVSGSGGGAGAYIDVIITSPASSYSYGVGGGGSGGSAGTSGAAGGSGAGGIIIVTEYYQ